MGTLPQWGAYPGSCTECSEHNGEGGRRACWGGSCRSAWSCLKVSQTERIISSSSFFSLFVCLFCFVFVLLLLFCCRSSFSFCCCFVVVGGGGGGGGGDDVGGGGCSFVYFCFVFCFLGRMVEKNKPVINC